MGRLEFTPRKGINCPNRMMKKAEKVETKQVVEKPIEVQISPSTVVEKPIVETIVPVRIAKVVDVKFEYMQKVKLEDINIIVEFSNDTLNMTHPTELEFDTSVLGKIEAVVHFRDLSVKHLFEVVKPTE